MKYNTRSQNFGSGSDKFIENRDLDLRTEKCDSDPYNLMVVVDAAPDFLELELKPLVNGECEEGNALHIGSSDPGAFIPVKKERIVV